MKDIENTVEKLNNLTRYCELLQSPDEYFQHMQGHRTELSMVLSAFDIANMNEIIVESLMKQIPHKIKSLNRNYNCPRCDKPAVLYSGEKLKFCKNCGQKLEW